MLGASEKEATLQGEKVLLAGCEQKFSGNCKQPPSDPEAMAWDRADTSGCKGEIGRDWVFGKIVHLLPIPLNFSVL